MEMVVIKRFFLLGLLIFSVYGALSGQGIGLLKDESIESVLDNLSKKYQVRFSYDPTIFHDQKFLPEEQKANSLTEALDKILLDKYSYRRLGSNIIITRQETQNEIREKQFSPTKENPGQKPITEAVQMKIKRIDIKEALSVYSPVKNENLKVEIATHLPVEKGSDMKPVERRLKIYPYISAFVWNSTIKSDGDRNLFTGLEGGISTCFHRQDWEFLASIGYGHGLSGISDVRIKIIPPETLDTMSNSYTTNKISFGTARIGLGYQLPVGFVKVAVRAGLAVSKMLHYNVETDGWEDKELSFSKYINNAFICIPIELNEGSIRQRFFLSAFAEFGLNNDFENMQFQSRRRLAGIRLSISI